MKHYQSFLGDVPFFGVQTDSAASLSACHERSEPIFPGFHDPCSPKQKGRGTFLRVLSYV
ncbi:hypothetical protein [Brevibacillus massiliensis]|uniref:hypothetical protein n=1 Tax=Brevibacillus massiliensis TaxID=1118054 RepID=UPI00164EB3AA|nr:hypothetical protein [Brevibacillus massiliensis]